MFACNQIAAAEADPSEAPSARDWMRPCPRGPHEPLADCALCGGVGAIREDPRELTAAPWLESCQDFLAAWSGIERYGFQVWRAMELDPVGLEPAPDLPEALSVFDAELNRLRREDDVQRARKARADRR